MNSYMMSSETPYNNDNNNKWHLLNSYYTREAVLNILPIVTILSSPKPYEEALLISLLQRKKLLHSKNKKSDQCYLIIRGRTRNWSQVGGPGVMLSTSRLHLQTHTTHTGKSVHTQMCVPCTHILVGSS